jgi:hypothetical protein
VSSVGASGAGFVVVDICLVTPSAPFAVIWIEVALVNCQLRYTVSPFVMLLLLALKTKVGGCVCVTVTDTCCGLLLPPGPVAMAV